MLPAATEIVGALGLMDQLLAVSHECDYPEEANRRPRITSCEIHGKGLPSAEVDRWVSERLRTHGTLYTLDEEQLRGLAPGLILTQRLCDVSPGLRLRRGPGRDTPLPAARPEPGAEESRGCPALRDGCRGGDGPRGKRP